MKREARRETVTGALTPGDAPEPLATVGEHEGEVPDGDRIASARIVTVEWPDLGRGLDGDGVVEAEPAHLLAELRRVAVGGVGEDDSLSPAVGDGTGRVDAPSLPSNWPRSDNRSTVSSSLSRKFRTLKSAASARAMTTRISWKPPSILLSGL